MWTEDEINHAIQRKEAEHNFEKINVDLTIDPVHPLSTKSRVAQALTEFVNDVGIPDTLLSDGVPEVVGPKTEFLKEVHRLKIRIKRSEVGRSNQNYAAEREIGELKKHWRNRMAKKNVPPRLWDYGLVYEANILNRILPRGSQQRTGLEIVTGETPDISEWTDFEFYNRVWFYDGKKGRSIVPTSGITSTRPSRGVVSHFCIPEEA